MVQRRMAGGDPVHLRFAVSVLYAVFCFFLLSSVGCAYETWPHDGAPRQLCGRVRGSSDCSVYNVNLRKGCHLSRRSPLSSNRRTACAMLSSGAVCTRERVLQAVVGL